MARQPIQFVNNEMYHICYRAVGDAVIFKDQDDYFRGIFSLYELNNSQPVSIWLRRLQRRQEKLLRGPTPQSSGQVLDDRRDSFVEILAFCFMPNHIHLVVKQLKENGISQFIQKVGTGYVTYFNKKYNRKGHLFNRFKGFHIANDDQLKNVITYVHCNPISLVEPGWKEGGISNTQKIIEFLKENYRWSSFWDYGEKKNFPSVTSRDFISDVVGWSSGIYQAIEDWVAYKGEIKQFDYSKLE